MERELQPTPYDAEITQNSIGIQEYGPDVKSSERIMVLTLKQEGYLRALADQAAQENPMGHVEAPVIARYKLVKEGDQQPGLPLVAQKLGEEDITYYQRAVRDIAAVYEPLVAAAEAIKEWNENNRPTQYTLIELVDQLVAALAAVGRRR